MLGTCARQWMNCPNQDCIRYIRYNTWTCSANPLPLSDSSTMLALEFLVRYRTRFCLEYQRTYERVSRVPQRG